MSHNISEDFFASTNPSKFHEIKQAIYGSFLRININKDLLFRSLIVAGLLILFSILETTFGARFQFFGATPDLMLSLVVAIAMSEGPKFGAITGIVAGVMIDALGGFSPSLSPLIYMPIGFFVAIIIEQYFSKSFLIRIIVTLLATIPRSFLTLFQLELYNPIPLSTALVDIVIPEYLSTVLIAFLPHLIVWVCLRSFHKTRDDKIK